VRTALYSVVFGVPLYVSNALRWCFFPTPTDKSVSRVVLSHFQKGTGLNSGAVC
jgi:hypothetical protein